MILDVLQEISYLLQTRLPYPWDFCRFDVDPTARLLLNSGSYFAVYGAFILWFVKYALTVITGFAGQDLQRKDFFIVAIIAAATATHVFWPLLLLSTYFITCSYYPWISALSVTSLYISDSTWTLFTVTVMQSLEYLRNMDFNWSLDGVNGSVFRSSDSNTYVYSGQSNPEIRRREDSPLFIPRPSPADTVRSNIVAGRYKESLTESVPEPDVDPVGKKKVTFRKSTQIFDESEERYHRSSPTIAARSHSTGNLRQKFGYCGRCWRGCNLPFKQGFTRLREPSTTRQGTIYGPPHRFLNLTDYLKLFGL